MATNYAYAFAEVRDADGLCVGVVDTTDPSYEGWSTSVGTTYYRIPVYDEHYAGKYYLNGSWYEDAEGTIPWTSSLL